MMRISKNSNSVIPAKAGIQRLYKKSSFISASHCSYLLLDTGLRRCDELLEVS
ncbi:hypothetical protein [Sideroxyarcus sp. TK5]